MFNKKNSIRKKYSLLNFDGKLANELQLCSYSGHIQQISHEDLDRINLGNLSSYSHSIENERVKNWLKSLVFSYKKLSDINEI